MLTPSISNLPTKLRRFLIGDLTCDCPSKLKDTIDAKFQQESLTPLKSTYIWDGGEYVIKGQNADGRLTTADTHLYRVLKAEKIRSYLNKNDLNKYVAVPKKFIYFHEKEKKFYVVAEKMNLSREVAKPASTEIAYNFKQDNLSGGQAKALHDGAEQRSLTSIQAKTLAELSILGYTALSYNNLYFTQEGKVAIIDTEPKKRRLKKAFNSSYFWFLFGDKGALLSQQSIAGIAKLKLYTDNPFALKAIQKVERTHVLWRMATLIAKIFAVTLVIYFTPTIMALIPIATLAVTLKVSLIAVAVLKNLFLILNILSVYQIWNYSYEDMPGFIEIYNLETKGAF